MWNRLFKGIIIVMIILMAIIYLSERQRDEILKTDTKTYEKYVAITFDDGPGKKTTPKLLDELKKRNVKASFFLVGENIPGNEEIVKRMHEEGHLIGNHTYTHVQLNTISKDAALNEVNKTNELIESITGEPVKYIRPPCGAWNDTLLYEINQTPVLWSVDPLDWCTPNVGVVVGRVMKNTGDGDIILFHDIYESSVVAALEVIDQLMARGYIFVTVDEIIIE